MIEVELERAVEAAAFLAEADEAGADDIAVVLMGACRENVKRHHRERENVERDKRCEPHLHGYLRPQELCRKDGDIEQYEREQRAYRSRLYDSGGKSAEKLPHEDLEKNSGT